MQIDKTTIERVKAEMKQLYPGNYALIISSRLRSRKIKVSRQQIYNFFNGLGAMHSYLIINSALELLEEAVKNKKNDTKT